MAIAKTAKLIVKLVGGAFLLLILFGITASMLESPESKAARQKEGEQQAALAKERKPEAAVAKESAPPQEKKQETATMVKRGEYGTANSPAQFPCLVSKDGAKRVVESTRKRRQYRDEAHTDRELLRACYGPTG